MPPSGRSGNNLSLLNKTTQTSGYLTPTADPKGPCCRSRRSPKPRKHPKDTKRGHTHPYTLGLTETQTDITAATTGCNGVCRLLGESHPVKVPT